MERGGQINPGSPENSDDDSGMTRRDFLKRAAALVGVVALGGVTTEMLTGCAEIPWEQRPLGELQPEAESEKKMLGVLNQYTEVMGKTGTNTEQAAILTQPMVRGAKSENVAASFGEYKSKYSADSDEAAILTATSISVGVGIESMGATYTDARNKARSHNENPVNVAVIAAYTHETVDEILAYEDAAKASEKAELVPIMALASASEEANDPKAELNAIRAAGVTDEKDISALLFARTFSNAPLSDLLVIKKELEAIPEVNSAVKSDLLMAAVYNNLDLESVLEAYNFAGTLEGTTVESAAKLTLAMFGSNVPTLKDGNSPKSAYNGSSVYFMRGYYGGYYGGYSYGYYPRSSTAFVPTSRGSSFSRPGKAPARSGGISGGTGGRGGVGGRGGGGTA